MIDGLMKYWPVLVVLGSFLSSWLLWSAKKQFVSQSALEAVKAKTMARVGGVEGRVINLETDMAVVKNRLAEMPTKEDLHRVELAVAGVSGELQGMAASQRAIERNLHLIVKSKIED